MRTAVSFVRLGVATVRRGEQLAPKLSIGSFVGSQIQRKAKRVAEACKGTIKYVGHCVCSNCRGIQIMELISYENSLAKIRTI